MGLSEPDIVIHIKHYLDGWPLCWPSEKDGLFDGTWDESLVTCPDCLIYLEE